MVIEIIRSNLKIIFANKFIYFLIFAFGWFFFFAIIDLFDAFQDYSVEKVYDLLILPGLMLMLYPTAFNLQTDQDAGTLEILFGIPNYRYKIWLVRFLIVVMVVWLILLILAAFSYLILIPLPVFQMSWQLLMPILFLGSLSLMFSTIMRSGNGTASIMVAIGFIAFLMVEPLEGSKWNIYINPFALPSDLSEEVWSEIIFYNRIYLLIGTILSVLATLLRLQKREKLVQS